MGSRPTFQARAALPFARLVQRTGLATRFLLVGMLVTGGIVSATFVALSAATERTARSLFAAEMARGGRTVAELHRQSLRDLLWTAGLTTRNPTLRAAIETQREVPDDSTTAAQLRATIRLEALRTQQDLGKDLLLITDRDGRVIAGAGPRRIDPAGGPDLSRVPAVRAALDPTAEVGAASYSVLEVDGEPYQVGVVPIEIGGYPIGALLLGDRLTTTFLDRIARASDGDLIVLAGGRAIASRGKGRPELATRVAAGGAVTDSLASGTIEVDGEEFAITAIPLGVDAAGAPVSLLLAESVTEALAGLDGALRQTFFLYGLLAIGLVGLAAAATGRALVRPLARFVEFQRSVTDQADYSRRFDASADGPEIRTLAESYEQLIGSLERQHQALQASQEQLRQSQKLEAIGTLAGGVAHDFNNLLTVILGNGETLLAELTPGTTAHEDVSQIVAAGQRAAGLTNQLLAFSRKRPVEPRVLDLVGVLNGLEGLLRRVIGEDVRLVTEVPPVPAWILGDANQFEQIVINLAVNARDAMPNGGRLGMSLRSAPDRIELAVSDTGVGMESAVRDRIFEPFFTTKGPGKGTGLGLSTVYGIVTQFGGTIAVESAPGAGTTFLIRLPPAAAPSPATAPAERGAAPASGRETVLVAEDEEPVRRFATRVLEKHGYRVLGAASGEEALERARSHPGPIPILVTDVVMPGMSGQELFRRLAAERPDIHVLFVSGYPDEMISKQGPLEPGAPFLAKPFTADQLVSRIQRRLDRQKVADAGR